MIFATGAWSRTVDIPGNGVPVIGWLRDMKAGTDVSPGPMWPSSAAATPPWTPPGPLCGPGSSILTLVYRRTKQYMPAEEEELELALADGVEFLELL